ncbi:putative HTH-type transcriptional regulator YahB [Polaromonas vacuolata]|uniref:Putative HTH-type transcriptional regulator YahB n=1 Tax=Polaromonas vacuolata TaxID=37448 RepID=A0A6H2H925_9BURK|nr:LysR family transcriptional regulator [Polaromonas vacuolata]QJC56381.1 putative HTH-type transcriptional regulator YahB [Polaromonas vacuolata]
MLYSPEALTAFSEAAALGSFSAAARKLGKSQSSISSAIANLEIDLGLSLFDRRSRKPTLTVHGQLMLEKAQGILAASDLMERAAAELGAGLEARLSVVWTDSYQSNRFGEVLIAFEKAFPDIKFECLIAENGDLVSLVQTGRAQIGVVSAQNAYPPDIGWSRIADESEIALFVAKTHELVSVKAVTHEMLGNYRELRLQTDRDSMISSLPSLHRAWSAPSYMMLMEMALQGFGWAAIPRWMVARFASTSLHEIDARGWPQRVPIDAVWCRQQKLGRAGSWLIREMLAKT